MTPRAMIDLLNVVDMVLEYAEAELTRVRFLMTPFRRFVAALRTGIRHAKTDLSFLIDAPEGGTR